jgi:hypothetical protein
MLVLKPESQRLARQLRDNARAMREASIFERIPAAQKYAEEASSLIHDLCGEVEGLKTHLNSMQAGRS